MAESDVIVVSSKGQVVIPQDLREKLGIGPKSKLLVYGHGDALVMKKIEVDEAIERLEELYKRIDGRAEKYGLRRLSEREINALVQKYRHGRKQGV